MRSMRELGEKKVIEKIIGCLDMMPSMPVPFGDDVSAFELDADRLAVVKTDMLVGKTDMPPGMNLRQAARKAVVMNISDFAAKGVKPLIILSSLGLPRTFTEEDVRQIGLGLNEGAREYDAYVVGGDTNEASDLVISCSLLGFCDKHSLMRRSGARPGDLLAVTGPFGKTSSGLKILLEGVSVPKEAGQVLVDAVLRPKAQLREGLALAQTCAITASIDSSDGLAWSLYELSDASNVGFRIDCIPLATEAIEFARDQGLDPLELCFYGGEEYELVVTVKPELWQEVSKVIADLGSRLIRIGQVTKEKKLELRERGGKRLIERKGWEHFRS